MIVLGKRDLYIQAVRGLAIAAVVLIHCLPQEAASVVLRPFLNFSVAAFIFISGYLTSRRKVAGPAMFLRRRFSKIAVPYMIWNTVYLIARGTFAPLAVIISFIVGGGSAQLYYLVVYLQLTLITPWLFRLLDRPAVRIVLYVVTPATLAIRYTASIADVSLPIQAFCGSWLVFYLLGLEWRGRISPWLREHGVEAGHIFSTLLACLVLQEAEGFAWFLAGDYDLATTQLKVTSLLSSICASALIASVGKGVREKLANCTPIVRLGDLSFGVYLAHMVVLAVVRKLLSIAGLDGLAISLMLWLAVLAITAALVALCQRVLPEKVLSAIGFV